MKRNSGSILIITLWVLSLLTVFSIGIASNVSSQINFASYFKNRLTMYYLAKAGIGRAIAELFMDQSPRYDTLNDTLTNNEEIFKELALDSGYFSVMYDLEGGDEEKENILYGAMDEASKININYAPVEALETLLETLGSLSEEEASGIADAIIDWRDVDNVPFPDGAEDDYYASLPAPYECKDMDFEILEELVLVKGMTPEIFSKIKDVITIYGEGKTNINTAGFSTFYALTGDRDFAEEIIEFRNGNDGIPSTEDDYIFETVEGLRDVGLLFTEEILNYLISLNVLAARSDVFRINSYGILEKKEADLKRKITCIVQRDQWEQGFQILYWHED